MKLRKDLRVKELDSGLVGTVTLVDGPSARVEFDNSMVGIYETDEDNRLAPAVGYYEWLRLAQLHSAKVEGQLAELRRARQRYLEGNVYDQTGASEMSRAIGKLMLTLGMP